MFDFEIKADLDAPIPVGEDDAVVHCSFRHGNKTAIQLKPGEQGAFNIGFRVQSVSQNRVIFEDRIAPEVETVAPGEWIDGVIRIPRSLLEFEDRYMLTIDMVKEEEYWFSEKSGKTYPYLVSFVAVAPADDATIDPADAVPQKRIPAAPADALALDTTFEALCDLDRPANSFHSGTARGTAGAWEHAPVQRSEENGNAGSGYTIVFDISDLIQYFHDARLPTGIQRVQIEIINNLLLSNTRDVRIHVVFFTKKIDTWVELPSKFFNALCKLSLTSGDIAAPDWLRVLDRLNTHVATSPAFEFPAGSFLVNLGTSWWLQNYFLNVRNAKAKYGIKYVPFVHDCIPTMTPEHCTAGLTRDFITWALGAFSHADFIMVNSSSTAKDVKRVARHLGHEIKDPAVVRLDADFRQANAALRKGLERVGAARTGEVLSGYGLRPEHYVLFVSTIESRKNHLLAFSAWLALLKRFGPRQIPKLVCVGNDGWLNAAIHEKLEASELLRQHVLMLSKVPDPELAALYENCLFTLYPSSYEGWGLPVTESLCYGKVPLLSGVSSLPEAAGEFGEFFSLDSESEFIRKLERLIFDPAYRADRERSITERFKPRQWADVAAQVVNLVKGWARAETATGTKNGAPSFSPFSVESGKYYGLTENLETHIRRGMTSGEVYRQGDGWWWVEPWGCWTKAKKAQLAFTIAKPKSQGIVIYFGIRGVQTASGKATIEIESVGSREIRFIANTNKWIVFRLDDQAVSQLERVGDFLVVHVSFYTDRNADFSSITKGTDHRIASLGVLGFMACEEADFASRTRLVESIVLDDLDGLNWKSADAELLPPGDADGDTSVDVLQHFANDAATIGNGSSARSNVGSEQDQQSVRSLRQ